MALGSSYSPARTATWPGRDSVGTLVWETPITAPAPSRWRTGAAAGQLSFTRRQFQAEILENTPLNSVVLTLTVAGTSMTVYSQVGCRDILLHARIV